MVNSIPGIGGIPTRNEWGGTMPISFLGHALRVLGSNAPDETLSAVGGEAFQFTYLDQPVDEPQRDHWPSDVFGDAAAAFGHELKWVLGADIEKVKRIVKEQVVAGHPVITHSLDLREHHGFHLIAGYDYDHEVFLVCPHGEGKPLVESPIPREWHGAVPGPAFWATNPLGILSERRPHQALSPRALAVIALKRAITIWELASFPFGPYPWEPGSHFDQRLDLSTLIAPSGRAAFETVIRDVTEAEAIAPRMVWRLDAQFERFDYNREDAARFLRTYAEEMPEHGQELLRKAAGLYETDRVLASQLLESFWNHGFYTLAPATREELNLFLRRTPSLVFGGVELVIGAVLGGLEMGKVESSVRGRVIVVDEPVRRDHAVAIARQLASNEEEAVRLLRAVLKDLEAIEPGASTDAK